MIKQDYDFEKQEDEDLRCPICNYYFSQVTKPYLLPCNHNLCYECIELITQKNTATTVISSMHISSLSQIWVDLFVNSRHKPIGSFFK